MSLKISYLISLVQVMVLKVILSISTLELLSRAVMANPCAAAHYCAVKKSENSANRMLCAVLIMV